MVLTPSVVSSAIFVLTVIQTSGVCAMATGAVSIPIAIAIVIELSVLLMMHS